MSPDPEELDPTDPFGLYRAEWLRDRLFELYKQPNYFPELETDRPCVLVGGRGTGKTTVLRCLSYEGRLELDKHNYEKLGAWQYVGFYHKVNTNRVTAFSGADVSPDKWRKAFGHYINLLLCGRVVEFLALIESKVGGVNLPEESCVAVAESLCVDVAENVPELLNAIQRGRRQFETYLNDLDDASLPRLSLQGQPIDELCESVRKLPFFHHKALFFIIDEFENLLDYQQEIINTLIKHSGTHYTFKIGVRELGWRRRATLNPAEQLRSPADYELIDIGRKLAGAKFEQFALEVCQLRAASLHSRSLEIDKLLPSLSLEQEALRLGVNDRVQAILDLHKSQEDVRKTLNSMSPLEAYFTHWWATSKHIPIVDVLAERASFGNTWKTRYENYKAAVLFTLKRGKSGLRRYYCGWPTYVKLADGNIRYLLELVSQARLLHLQEGQNFSSPITAEVQTHAAIEVGRKNLTELEGLSVDGAQLTKLLLGLGRIFEVMANTPEGHAPEVNQFHLPDDTKSDDSITKLLTAAVMHLALVRSTSNKRMDLDIKSYDYAVHPIFAAFFGFSHRKKRKMILSAAQLSTLIQKPRAAIKEILGQSNRTPDEPLPDQLQLFEGYYGGA